MIPKIIHKIFLNDTIDRIPADIAKRGIASWKMKYPNHKLYVWDEQSGQRLILTHFGTYAVQLYRTLKPLAFRADFLRACILLVHGGIYSDLKQEILKMLPLDDTNDMLLVMDRNVTFTQCRPVQNCLIGCAPGDKRIRTYFDRICANVRAQNYGVSPIDVTGPECFAKALRQCVPCSVCMLHFELRDDEFVITANGEVIINHKFDGTGSGDWSALSEEPYHDQWEKRSVFRDQPPSTFLTAEYFPAMQQCPIDSENDCALAS